MVLKGMGTVIFLGADLNNESTGFLVLSVCISVRGWVKFNQSGQSSWTTVRMGGFCSPDRGGSIGVHVHRPLQSR